MLPSFVILLLLVGAATAAQQDGWKNGKEYTYKVRSRTLAAFDSKSKHYSGILMEALLMVQPNGQDSIRAKVIQPRYSQIHTHLENGWDSHIPQDYINLENLPLSGQPFEIKMKNGVMRDMIVDKDVPTWEVNILKGIVSQLHIDTQGENAKKSRNNQFPEDDYPNALFKVMEDSVTGKCEVLYDISSLPDHELQTKPELAPLPELRQDGEFISIIKTKNYSNCDQRISYHFGISSRNRWIPGSNDNGKYLTRSSVSRVIISGSTTKYTIQSSVTINKVVHGLDGGESEQSMVLSKMNLTLHEMKDVSEQLQAPTKPQSIGNLVYNYNNPFEHASARRPNNLNSEKKNVQTGNSDESDISVDTSNSIYDNNDNMYLQPRPTLTEAPRNPMLPYFIGNKGNNIQKNNKIDAVKSCKSIAQQIGNDVQNPDVMVNDHTLEKFTILTRIIRTMSADQIHDVQRDVYEQPHSANQLNQQSKNQKARRNTWMAFRDAVAQAGTGPALLNIKQWIQNNQVQDYEAANIVDTVAKSARTPTPEYMDAFFELVTMPETKKDSTIHKSAILAFADLIRRSAVNKRIAHRRYPVHVFGRFFTNNNHNVHEKYIPYMSEELKSAVEKGQSKKIQTYITAIGRTGDPRMLSIFEPYLEGEKQISPFQRMLIVLSLDKLVESNPRVARQVLYKIYANNADRYEIRIAAVNLLMKTNPPASMLQRMAEFTNYDSNRQVNSAVKSIIESFAALQDSEYSDLSNAARSAKHLLTPETYSFLYSRTMIKTVKNPLTKSKLLVETNFIGSDDSDVPKGLYVTGSPTIKGVKLPEFEYGSFISSWRDLVNFIDRKLTDNKTKDKEQKFSPENIAKMLHIHGDAPEQIEGFMSMCGGYSNLFLPFDNHSLENIPMNLLSASQVFRKGQDFDETWFHNYEITTSFPVESGLPFHFTLKIPTVLRMNGHVSLKMDNDTDESHEKLLNAAGKINTIHAAAIQKRLSFVAPFTLQEYVVGIDRNLQMHIPISLQAAYHVDKKEASITILPNPDYKKFKIIQYETQPFTSKHNILNLEPISKDKNTYVIGKNDAVSSHTEFKNKDNDPIFQFAWEHVLNSKGESSNNEKGNAVEALTKLSKAMTYFSIPDNLEAEYQKYSINLAPSNDISAKLTVSYDSLITESNNNGDESETWTPKAKALILGTNLNEHERKNKLLKEASKNINSAKATAVDVKIDLFTGMHSTLTMTGAIGTSNVDQRTRALFVSYVSGKAANEGNYYISAGFERKQPHLESLDYNEILKANTPVKFDTDIRFGIIGEDKKEENLSSIKIVGETRLTEKRKNEIIQSSDAAECTKQQKHTGNKLTIPCGKVNKQAASTNAAEMTIILDKYTLLHQLAKMAVESIDDKSTSSDSAENSAEEDGKYKVKVMFNLSSAEDSLDVAVTADDKIYYFKNLNLNDDTNNDKDDKMNENDENPEVNTSVDNICAVDKSEVKTFDKLQYPLDLGQCWHVVMTTFPKYDPDNVSQLQPVPNDAKVSILARENENKLKEFKVILGNREIELTASVPHHTHAKVNGKKVEYSQYRSYEEQEDGNVSFEILELADKSTKVASDLYGVVIIYDGYRAQIEAGDDYHNSIRGLCGNYDGEQYNDLKTPKGCILQKPDEFAATYALINEDKCSGSVPENVKKAKAARCIFEQVRPGNVISNQEAGRINKEFDKNLKNVCMQYITKLVESEHDVCFSIRPVSVCSSKCNATAMKNKDIQFYCVARNSESEELIKLVQKGAHPDFSTKTASKTISQLVPISCKP